MTSPSEPEPELTRSQRRAEHKRLRQVRRARRLQQAKDKTNRSMGKGGGKGGKGGGKGGKGGGKGGTGGGK
ncbi:MAG: hypothetical protein ACYC1D_05785 [Acidimicrobiales bacterium]